MVKQLSTPPVQHMTRWDQKFITGGTLSKPTPTTQSSKADRTAKAMVTMTFKQMGHTSM
jgi:hypothetical protein